MKHKSTKNAYNNSCKSLILTKNHEIQKKTAFEYRKQLFFVVFYCI